MCKTTTHLTPKGLEKIKAELATIQSKTLPDLERKLLVYREQGDTDNPVYIDLREQHHFFTQRIDVLERLIADHLISGETSCELTDVEKQWQEFWAGIVLNEDGSINLEQVKKELFDFQVLMRNAGKVYEHVTGGQLTKTFADPDIVCREADEYYRRSYEEIEV